LLRGDWEFGHFACDVQWRAHRFHSDRKSLIFLCFRAFFTDPEKFFRVGTSFDLGDRQWST
jgi:hypothetical protein